MEVIPAREVRVISQDRSALSPASSKPSPSGCSTTTSSALRHQGVRSFDWEQDPHKYQSIGRTLLQRTESEVWGSRFITQLAHDLRAAFPEMKGFSPSNLKYMRLFARAWPDRDVIGQQDVKGTLHEPETALLRDSAAQRSRRRTSKSAAAGVSVFAAAAGTPSSIVYVANVIEPVAGLLGPACVVFAIKGRRTSTSRLPAQRTASDLEPTTPEPQVSLVGPLSARRAMPLQDCSFREHR